MNSNSQGHGDYVPELNHGAMVCELQLGCVCGFMF